MNLNEQYDQQQQPLTLQGRELILARLLNGLSSQTAPEREQDYLGVGAEPQPQPAEAAAPHEETMLMRVLENLSGLATQQHAAPRSFGEGLVQGVGQGLGTAGSRIAAQRVKYETAMDKRQQDRDTANLAASEHYRQERGRAISELSKEQRTSQQKKADYERDNPTVDDRLIAQYGELLPGLSRIKGGRISRTTLDKAVGTDAPDSQIDLEPQEVDMLARLGIGIGAIPGGLGMGKAGAAQRKQVVHRMAEIAPPGTNLATNRAVYSSKNKALGIIQQAKSQTAAFEQTFNRNADMLLTVARRVPDTGIPLVNRPVRSAIRALGGKTASDFEAALLPVQSEASRLLTSGPSMGGQLSDTARQELQSVIRGDFTYGQLEGVLKVLRQDATNRSQSYDDAIGELQGSIGSIGSRAGRSGKPITHRYDPDTDSYEPVGEEVP